MTAPLDYLCLGGIAKSFGQFAALRQIDLSIAKGEFICFLGPSGCGKTTLLRIIAGLEVQDRGSIVQNGRDVSWAAPIERDYGIVFQSYALFPNLTVFDNVAYGLVNRGQNKAQRTARVQELLTLVGLPDSGAKYPAQLSGGQQQRIALARALATSPGLLLLDEPLSALDALERVRLRGEIRALQQRLGVTTIMVTHDQEEALAMADRIVVMEQGQIRQIGTPEQVYLQPESPFVASFVGKINVLPAIALGDGRLRLGSLELPCPPPRDPSGPLAASPSRSPSASPSGSAAEPAPRPATASSGQALDIYLRPEELLPATPAHPWQLDGQLMQIEFLGAQCLLTWQLAGLEAHPVQMALPLYQMQHLQLQVGSHGKVALLAERLRVFNRLPHHLPPQAGALAA